MEDILDEEELDQPQTFTDQEIFTFIWTRPRSVFKFLNDYKYDKFLYPLMILVGIVNAFERVSDKSIGDSFSLLYTFAICIIFGGLFGWVSYYFYAALMSWTGKALDGKANTSSILRVLAYASFPHILTLILLILSIVVYGHNLLTIDGELSGHGLISTIFILVFLVIQLALSLATVVLGVIGISEVQGFGIGKAILNFIIPILLLMIPFLLIYVLS